MNDLAETLRALGDSHGTLAPQERIVPVSRRVLGDEHPDTLVYMHNLAATLRAHGELTRARELQEQVLTKQRLHGE